MLGSVWGEWGLNHEGPEQLSSWRAHPSCQVLSAPSLVTTTTDTTWRRLLLLLDPVINFSLSGGLRNSPVFNYNSCDDVWISSTWMFCEMIMTNVREEFILNERVMGWCCWWERTRVAIITTIHTSTASPWCVTVSLWQVTTTTNVAISEAGRLSVSALCHHFFL